MPNYLTYYRHRERAPGPIDGVASNHLPLQYTGLKIWHAVRREVGYSNGNALGTLIDWSGNGNNATQSTAGNKPTYTTGGPNSQPYALFDTTNDYMLWGSSLALVKDHSFIAVVARTNTSSIVTVCGGDHVLGTYALALDATTMYYSPSGFVSVAETNTTGTFYIQGNTRTGETTGNGQVTFYHNSATGVGPSGGTLGSTLNLTVYGLAAYDNGSQLAPGMNLCELLIYNRRLSSVEMTAVITYLNGIYTIF